MKFRIRFADQVVGIFVLLAIAGIVVILVFIGINQRWFAKDYYFTSKFPSAEGISVGMPITLQGFEIGKISRISLTDDDQVDLQFYVEDTYVSKVRQYSVLELSSSPIGLGTSLKLLPGKPGTGGVLAEYSLVPLMSSEQGKDYVDKGLVELPEGTDTISSLLGRVNPILDETKVTMDQIKKLASTLDTALSGKGGPLGDMIDRLAQTPDKINQAVDVVSQRVDNISNRVNDLSDRLNGTIDRINVVAQNLQVISQNLMATSEGLKDTKGLATRLLDPQGSINTVLNDNNQLYSQVQDAISKVDQILAQIRGFVDYINSSRPQISSILERGNTVLNEGSDVLEAAKNNPLLKGGVPEQKPQGTTVGGYRDDSF